MHKSVDEQVQGFIHSLESGGIAAFLKRTSVLLGFAALAVFYNFTKFEGFNNAEAMESAHLARQMAQGQGYTTDSIRPFAVHLLQEADPTNAARVLQHPLPDISNPPGYPCLLALAMKVLPFRFIADSKQQWFYQPELWIRIVNEVIYFMAMLVLFRIAKRLFDEPVAWLSALIFAGTEMFWRFSSAGLSTIWLILILLCLIWCLVALEERERSPALPSLRGSVGLAATVGLLAGLGSLTLYSFAWMMIPILFFLRLFLKRAPALLMLTASLCFLAVFAPWIVRNIVVSQTPFGTAGYALAENTPHLEGDILERSLNPGEVLRNVSPGDVMNKFVLNEGSILENNLPRLGGNWACAFFLVGLLLPYRKESLQRFRLFLVWSLLVLAVAQAFCQTHLSTDSPDINSENLLILLAPLVLIFGVGVFLNFLDHVDLPDLQSRRGALGLYGVVMCAPMLLTLFGPPKAKPITPYSPSHVERVAAMMHTNELMMSDIPWGVAWYGNRPCAWLTLNDDQAFKDLNKIKPVRALFLTQRTSDHRFLSQMIVNQDGNQSDWNFFYLDSLPGWGHGMVPSGFPLQKAILDYPPDQMFISDSNRWHITPKSEKIEK